MDLDHADALQLTAADPAEGDDSEELLALDEALTRLEAEEPQAAAVVKLRYFAGMTTEEAAAAIDISVRTANRHWAYAKAWLYQQLCGEGDAGV